MPATTWIFTGTANYNDIGSDDDYRCIDKANATVVVDALRPRPLTAIRTRRPWIDHRCER